MSTRGVRAVRVLTATIAIALTGLAAAQQQPPSGDADARDEPVTLTGCLVRVDQSNWRPGTTGSTERGQTPKQSSGFVLKNVATKASATAQSKRSEREVAVTADNVDLTPHAGREVEVTGRFEDPAPPRGAAGRAASTGSEPGATSSQSPYGLASDFTITAIRTTAASCGPR
jgi:hypothetical protein